MTRFKKHKYTKDIIVEAENLLRNSKDTEDVVFSMTTTDFFVLVRKNPIVHKGGECICSKCGNIHEHKVTINKYSVMAIEFSTAYGFSVIDQYVDLYFEQIMLWLNSG